VAVVQQLGSFLLHLILQQKMVKVIVVVVVVVVGQV
jgi:hypothetical protein